MIASKRKRWLILAALVIALTGWAYAAAGGASGMIKRRVIAGLEWRLESTLTFENTVVNVFPRVSVSIEKVALRHHGRTDVPPLMAMDRLTLTASIAGLLSHPRRIASARIEGLQIHTPPKGQNSAAGAANQPQPKARKKMPELVVDEVTAEDAILQTLPRDPRNNPRQFDIHRLTIRSFGFDRPASFHAELTNPAPVGEIDSQGQFGPWNADEPGDTPVNGTFRFSHADFATLRGLRGILSSEGKYSGKLNRLDVTGHTETPDFALAKVGNPIPLSTDYVAVVDGTNGNTYLNHVEAALGESVIVAKGQVVGRKGVKGRHIYIEANASRGRIEDLLRLTIKGGGPPPMRGTVNLAARIDLPPGAGDILDRLAVQGRFGVGSGRFTDPHVQEKLDSLSRKGSGQPENESIQDVLSNVRGNMMVRRGIVTFSNLAFEVPGAAVQLRGSYNLDSEELDFHGHLLMDAKISQTTTGAKSVFLKLIDPFFGKPSGGSSVPIQVTGKRSDPDIGLDIL
jgi:hypothetical protein